MTLERQWRTAAGQLAKTVRKYQSALVQIEELTRNVNTRRSQRSKQIHQIAATALKPDERT